MPKVTIRFRVRDKGGKSAGKIVEGQIPEFNWESFKNAPNAEAFVKKAYLSVAQRLVREVNEGSNGTEEHHLESIENLIARSLKFTKKEIKEWCDSRNWSNNEVSSKWIKFLTSNLPNLAISDDFQNDCRTRAAEIVAQVSDKEADPVADYLFAKLTMERKSEQLLLDELL